MRLAVMLVVFLVLCLLIFHVAQSMKFIMESTSPSLNNVGADSPFIRINFSKQLSKKGLLVKPKEGNFIYSTSVAAQTLTVNFNQLQPNRSYTINIASIGSTGGKELHNINLTFTAKNLPFNKLTTDQQKAIVGAQDKYPDALKDPILAHLPYDNLYFELNATFQGNPQQLILEAQILLAPGVTGAAATADVAQYEAQVVAYIKSLGLNPANYTIQYQIVNESLTPL